jgi:hypothetical protein
MKKTASAFGVAILGLGSSFLPSSAQAAELADCGTAPAGGTLTLTGDVCQLTFSTPGTYSFTTPSSALGIAGLLVGGGGGSDNRPPAPGVASNIGYAGSGGKVTYVDLTEAVAGDVISMTVGGGGASSTAGSPLDGEASTMTRGVAVSTAAGGTKGNGSIYCVFEGDNLNYYGVGDGAAGNTPSRAGEACVLALGVNPSLGAVDSTGNAASDLFASINQEFGSGGKLVKTPAALPSRYSGAGANIVVDTAFPSSIAPVADSAGANGLATIVWQLPAPAPVEPTALADTGSDAYAPLLVGAGAMALGAVMFSRAGRRRVR